MKIFLVLVALISSLMAADAESAAMELDYYENFDKALLVAKKENKLLMLVMVQDPCPFCDKLIENTLSDAKVKAELKDVVCVVIDKTGKYPEAFKTSFVPRTYFLDSKKEKIVAEALGYAKRDHFLMTIDEAKESQK